MQVDRLQSTLAQLEKTNETLRQQKTEAEAAFTRRNHELSHENRQLRLRLQQCGLEVREIRSEEARMRQKRAEADKMLQEALQEALRDKETAEREVARLSAQMQELKGRNVELEKLLREGGGGNAAPQSGGLDDPNTTYSLRHLEEVNLRTRKINDDNHQLKLEISTLKVQMKEQETALRHEHAEEMHGLKAQHKADMLALIEDRDQQILKIQREANEQQMNDQRNRSGEVSKLEEERRVLMQKLERASDDVYNARQQYNGELSLLRRALQCQQKEHEKAVAVMSGMCQQIEFVESQYRVIVEEKTKADRELLGNLGNTEQELQRMRTRFADQERWTAYLNSVIETVEDERDMHESGQIERDKRIEALQKEIALLNDQLEKAKKEKDNATEELQRKGMDTELEVARREKEIMQAQVRLEAEQTEIMEGKLKSMEAHVAALEQECTRLADARDWLESEKIIMEQDLMAEIHRLEQEVRRAHDERDRLSLVQRIFDDQQQRGGAGAP